MILVILSALFLISEILSIEPGCCAVDQDTSQVRCTIRNFQKGPKNGGWDRVAKRFASVVFLLQESENVASFQNMSSLLYCFCGKLSSHMFCHSGWIDIWHLVILNIWKQIYFCVQICSHSQGASGDWEACSAYCNQVVNISCFCAAAISGILKLSVVY